MVIKYKIRGNDWLTFPLITVNFNHFFIQPAPDELSSLHLLNCYKSKKIMILQYNMIEQWCTRPT